MRRVTLALTTFAVFVVAGCTSTGPDRNYVATGAGFVPARPSPAVDRVRSAVADRTTIVGQRASSGGLAVTYLAKDGSGYVWSSNSDDIIKIQWTIEDSVSGNGIPNVCYDSPQIKPNFMESRKGERINCLSALFASATDTVVGDPIGLSRRAVGPFRLRHGQYSLAELVARVRGD